MELGEDLITLDVSCIECLALVSSWKVENLDHLNVGWLGVFITPTTKLAVWWGCLSHGAPDSVRCASHVTRGLHAELFTFGKIQRRSTIIHRTIRCTPDSVRCPREERLWNSPASGICSAIIHRTCPVYTGLSGEPAEQRLFGANGHLLQH